MSASLDITVLPWLPMVSDCYVMAIIFFSLSLSNTTTPPYTQVWAETWRGRSWRTLLVTSVGCPCAATTTPWYSWSIRLAPSFVCVSQAFLDILCLLYTLFHFVTTTIRKKVYFRPRVLQVFPMSVMISGCSCFLQQIFGLQNIGDVFVTKTIS